MKTALKILGAISGMLISILLFIGVILAADKLMEVMSDNLGDQAPWVLFAVFLLGGIGYGGALAGYEIVTKQLRK